MNTDIVRNIILPFWTILEQYEIVSEIEHRPSVVDEIEKTVERILKQAKRLHQTLIQPGD